MPLKRIFLNYKVKTGQYVQVFTQTDENCNPLCSYTKVQPKQLRYYPTYSITGTNSIVIYKKWFGNKFVNNNILESGEFLVD